MAGKAALIAGASGLVGGELLNYLLQGKDYDKVISIGRRSLNCQHPKLEQRVVDFTKLDQHKDLFQAADVFCCLGTTIKKAKTKEAMKKVDVDYPLALAQRSKEMGAEKFLVVSSMQASVNSLFWYARMKGLLENELQKVGFKSLHIFRPSLLLGKREEFRLGESLGALFFTPLSFAFQGPLKKYKAIKGKTVAWAMYKAAQSKKTGVHVYLSDEIEELGRK